MRLHRKCPQSFCLHVVMLKVAPIRVMLVQVRVSWCRGTCSHVGMMPKRMTCVVSFQDFGARPKLAPMDGEDIALKELLRVMGLCNDWGLDVWGENHRCVRRSRLGHKAK